MSLFRLIDRKLLLAGTFVALATACCFHQLVLHPGDLLVGCQRDGLNDVTNYWLASRSYPGFALSQFRQLPFWNPCLLAGTPFTGNPQSALFYPPNGIFLFLKPAATISWLLVLHHFWAGFGTVLLSRRYGLSLIGSVAAGVIFLSAPFLVAQTGEGHYNQIFAVSWIPWSFLAWERLKQQQRSGILVMAFVMTMSFFCGHAQEVFYLGLILTLLTMAEVVRLAGAERTNDARILLQQWLLAGIATAGLIAIDLLPAWKYSRLTIRSGPLNVEEAAGLNLANLWQLIDPFILGHPAQPVSVQSVDFYWETICYFGVAPLALAILGTAVGLKLRQQSRQKCSDEESHRSAGGTSVDLSIERMRRSRQFSVLFVFTLAFAFGAGSPVFEAFHRYVPGVAMFRIPSRMLFFSSFAVAMLAGIGVDALASRRRKRLTPILCSVIALAVLETSLHAHQVLRTAPPDSLRTGGPLSKSLGSNADFARTLVQQQVLSDHEAAEQRIWKIQGYEPVCLLPYVAAFRSATPEMLNFSDRLFGFAPVNLSDFNKPVIDMLGVRWAVITSDEQTVPAGWKLHASVLQPPLLTLRNGKSEMIACKVYENTSVLPRARVVGRARTLRAGEDGSTALSSCNLREEVLLSMDVLPEGPRAEPGTATIEHYSANEVVISAVAAAPGYLLLSDSWSPGWTATVDDKPAQVLRANLAFRAVPLLAGEHIIRFRFQPPGLSAGLTISLLTLVLLLWLSCRQPTPRETPVP